jgi:hypothetical protein
VEIISLMQAKNYDFRLIGDSIEGDKIAFMRHDIDLSLSAAETMAEVDNQCGIRSTFYFMLRSNFYNLFSPEAKRVLYRVSNLGHRIELHFVAWDTDASEECDPYRLEEAIQNEFLMGIYYYGDLFYKTVSFHHPPKGVLGLKLANYVNAYEDMYFRNIKYLSESLQRWREGDLYQIIEENRYDKLQILIHPVLWVLGSYSIKATMKSFMAAQRSTWERFIREDWIPY